MKASTNANHVVGLLAAFSQAQQAQRNKDNKRRAQERRNALHRNMIDYHHNFIHSPSADDDSDAHIFNRKALSKTLPQKDPGI